VRKQLEFQALQVFKKCLKLSESPLSVSGGRNGVMVDGRKRNAEPINLLIRLMEIRIFEPNIYSNWLHMYIWQFPEFPHFTFQTEELQLMVQRFTLGLGKPTQYSILFQPKQSRKFLQN